ncbi:ABC transporter substrate-binding protein [Candidatus Uhrbacteria bacterium]|nr:ABC transporter substrate-binding protein [Candidatus Uhrbacteria bacterium]
MKKWLHIFSVIGAIILLFLGGYLLFREPPATVVENEIVKVGWIGHGDHRAIDLALKDLNMEDVEIIFREVECDREKTVEASRELISQGVVVAISELCSETYYQASETFKQDGVIMIQASSDLVDYVDEPMFRTVPHQRQVLAYGIDYLRGKGIENIAVVGSSEEWAQPLNSLIADLFTEEGRTLTFVSLQNDQGEEIVDEILSERLTELKEVDPDVVYIVARGADPARIMTLAEEIELEATMYGIGELFDDVDELGEIGNDLRVVVVGGGSSGFEEQYRIAYGEDSGMYSAHAYDAMTAVARVLREGANTREAMVASLQELSFEGASGKIDFTDNGHIPGRFEVRVLKDGEFIEK